MTLTRFLTAVFSIGAAAALVAQTPPPQAPPAAQQPDQIRTTIVGAPGLPPKIAVPDFIPLTSEPETVAAAKTIGQVLWDDLNFEREFYLIPRDTYRSIPQPASVDQVPLDRWKELGADGVVVGTIRRNSNGYVVEVRLLQVSGGRVALGKQYSGSLTSVKDGGRIYAHTASDDIHQTQRGLRGVARTKLAFSSDRDGTRMRGPVSDRDISNIYRSDYDGANQVRLTYTASLDISPVWAPDGGQIAYTSWRSGYPDIIVQSMTTGTPPQRPARGSADVQNYLPAWSPDGTKIAFTSSRDGNPEIYYVNRDGSGLHRVTNSPAVDVTPTWSPAPFNEIAYTSQAGAGHDIRVYDFSTGQTRTITDGIGSNESPAFAPNGRHIAFSSDRTGIEQIYVIDRDGKNLRQLTKTGRNRYPNWSQ
jgi:TolB protein